MKKIILVEDNRNFKDMVESIVERSLPECTLVMFSSAQKAIAAISSTEKDFDVLLLDGDLGFGGHGRSVLNTLSPEEIRKVIICSGSDSFIEEAEQKGVSVFLDKEFLGIRPSKIDEHFLEILGRI